MILNFSQKKRGENPESVAPKRELSEEVTEAEFIPYAAHLDPHTLVTKNGELLQTIKITANADGLAYEAAERTGIYLRDALRRALQAHIATDCYSFWMHTRRRRTNIEIPFESEEDLAEYVNDAWFTKNHWQHELDNEFYLTVLHEGQAAHLFDVGDFRQGFLPRKNRDYRGQALAQVQQELDGVMQHILVDLKTHFEAKRLSVVERRLDEVYLIENSGDGPQTAFFSEPLEFIGIVLNLEDTPMMMGESDLSQLVSGQHELTFGFNTMESRSKLGRRRFAAMLTLKSYKEMSTESLDLFLQLPHEYILSQSLTFCDREEALKSHLEQKEMVEISGDFVVARVSGLEDMLIADQGNPTDFGMLQTSILVIVDDWRELDRAVQDIQAQIAKLGLVSIREEIRLEETFWAQLPGNFEFIRRARPVNSARLAGLARLNRYPSGSQHGNHWGDAVTILPTLLRTPYFFNFHVQDCGHTAVIDYNTFIDTVGTTLLNFLLVQARKFGGRTYIFDQNAGASLFMRKMEGSYHTVRPHERSGLRPMQLNPLRLPDDKRNRSFILAWMTGLAFARDDENEALRAKLQPYVDKIFERSYEERTLANLLAMIDDDDDETLITRFAAWHGEGKFAGIFDSGRDDIEAEYMLQGFDLTRVTEQPECIVPVFSYLLHRVISDLDGRPTILLLNEAWALLDNPFFQPRLQSLLTMLMHNNAMVIFYTKHIENYVDRPITEQIIAQTATRIYLPDDVGTDYTGEQLGLSAHDMRVLDRMDRQKGQLLIKHGNEQIGAELNLDDLTDIKAILSGDYRTLTNCDSPFV